MANNPRFNWSTAANIATVLSIFLSIGAIGVSLWQFNRSVDELYQERRLRNEENRPLMTIDSMGVNLHHEISPYNPKPSWSYTFRMKNVGVRPASELSVTSWVVGRSYFDNDTTYSAFDKYAFNYANAISKDVNIEYVGGADITSKSSYYLKLLVTYKDRLTKHAYQDTFYYSTDLYTPIEQKEEVWPIFDTDRATIKEIDSLINRLYKE